MKQFNYFSFAHPLGHFLVAASEAGLAFVGISDANISPEEIRAYYADAVLTENREAVLGYWEQVKALLAGEKKMVPLDIGGTVFQKQVWEAMRRVPYGQTVTYTELATACGKPGAVRAVASACGANPVCVVLPCHRILRKGGGLGGFAWGLPVKERLLRHEAQTSRVSSVSA